MKIILQLSDQISVFSAQSRATEKCQETEKCVGVQSVPLRLSGQEVCTRPRLMLKTHGMPMKSEPREALSGALENSIP